jgi:hypothetical protein
MQIKICKQKKRKQVHQKEFVVGTCCCKKLLQVGMCVIVGTCCCKKLLQVGMCVIVGTLLVGINVVIGAIVGGCLLV